MGTNILNSCSRVADIIEVASRHIGELKSADEVVFRGDHIGAIPQQLQGKTNAKPFVDDLLFQAAAFNGVRLFAQQDAAAPRRRLGDVPDVYEAGATSTRRNDDLARDLRVRGGAREGRDARPNRRRPAARPQGINPP